MNKTLSTYVWITWISVSLFCFFTSLWVTQNRGTWESNDVLYLFIFFSINLHFEYIIYDVCHVCNPLLAIFIILHWMHAYIHVSRIYPLGKSSKTSCYNYRVLELKQLLDNRTSREEDTFSGLFINICLILITCCNVLWRYYMVCIYMHLLTKLYDYRYKVISSFSLLLPNLHDFSKQLYCHYRKIPKYIFLCVYIFISWTH